MTSAVLDRAGRFVLKYPRFVSAIFWISWGLFMIALRIAAVSFILLAAAPAVAVNPKQVIEGCRESVCKPIVMACSRWGGGHLGACREKAKPRVQACVQAAMEKSLPKQAAP